MHSFLVGFFSLATKMETSTRWKKAGKDGILQQKGRNSLFGKRIRIDETIRFVFI